MNQYEWIYESSWEIHPRVLKELAEIPADWKLGNAIPIYKKCCECGYILLAAGH